MKYNIKKYLVSEWWGNKNRPHYLLGNNVISSTLLPLLTDIPLKGIIDEYTKENEQHGLPIIHDLREIPKDAIVLNCVFSAHAVSAQHHIESFGLSAIDIFAFQKYSEIVIDIPHYSGFNKVFIQNELRFNRLYNRLADTKSKEILCRLIDFRFNQNLDAMSVFKFDAEGQYFEPFLCLNDSGESFVDVGGYDGYTSEQFMKHCPHYKDIFILEPGEEYLNIARKRFTGKKNVYFLQIEASSEKKSLFFAKNGVSSVVSLEKGEAIDADRLDNVLTKTVSFIKIDVEGSESSVIEGAKNTILNDWPIIAISVYHQPDDYLSLFEQILSIREDYRVYLRHYTEGVDETVMYFVPENRPSSITD